MSTAATKHMGAGLATAKNIVNTMVTSTVNEVNKTVESCVGSVDQVQSIWVEDVKGNVIISNVDFGQVAKVDTNCILKNNTTQYVKSTVDEQVKQFSKAVELSGLGLGVADSENVANMATAMLTNVMNTFFGNIASMAAQTQTIHVQHVDGSVEITDIYMRQDLQNCLTGAISNDTTQKAEQSLVVALDQTAKATQAGMLGLLVLAVVLVVVVLVGGAVKKLLTDPRFWFALLILGGGVLVGFYFPRWWPYVKVDLGATAEKQKSQTLRDNVIVGCAAGAVALGVVGEVVASVYIAAKKKRAGSAAAAKAKTH
jgi:hypothetical protein